MEKYIVFGSSLQTLSRLISPSPATTTTHTTSTPDMRDIGSKLWEVIADEREEAAAARPASRAGALARVSSV
jgi:hypothetical protein